MNPIRNFSLSQSKSNNKKGISNGVKKKYRPGEKDCWLLVICNGVFAILFILCTNTILFAGNPPFRDGEKLKFSLRWIGMIGGKSTIEVKEELLPIGYGQELLPDSKKNSYLLNASLRTVGLADILFRIRNEFSSLIILNSKKVLPVWWEVIQKEKNYKYQGKTDFNEMLKKDPQIQSPLSSLCLLRSKDWQMEESIAVPVFVHGKIYPIKVQVVSKEPLKIYGKIFNTILLDVAVEGAGVEISSTKLKNLKIWLTDDEKKLPVLMKASTSVGIITVLLDNRKEFYKED